MNYNDYINSSEPNEEFKEKTKLKVASAVSAQRSRRKRTLAGLVAVFAIVAVAGTSFMLKDRIKSVERNEITHEQVTVSTVKPQQPNIADNQPVTEKSVEQTTVPQTEAQTENNNVESEDVDNETKDDCTIIENKDFTDDCVLVVYKHAVSKYKKVHTADEFPEVEIESMQDLSDGAMPENEAEYHQIYVVYLKNKGKEEVIKAVDIIAKYDYVKYVGPNYIDKAELL